jgi:hypothetical protein
MSANGKAPATLLVCDEIYFSPTGKPALVGVFTTIDAPSFPTVHRRMAVFAQFDGVAKGDRLLLSARYADASDPLVTLELTADEPPSPDAMLGVFVVERLALPRPGALVLTLTRGAEELGRAFIHVRHEPVSSGEAAA